MKSLFEASREAQFFQPWALVLFIFAILLIFVALFFGRVKEVKRPKITITDITFEGYQEAGPYLDIHIQNNGNQNGNLSRILFLVIEKRIGSSPIGYQEISYEAELFLDESIEKGDVLEARVAVNVEPDTNERIRVRVSWLGEKPLDGQYYWLLPSVKTSVGYVQGSPVLVDIQQSEEGMRTMIERHGEEWVMNHNPYMNPPELQVPDDLDWEELEQKVRRLRPNQF